MSATVDQMSAYLVVLFADPSVRPEKLTEKFPDRYRLREGAWVVNGEQQTCGDVAAVLGIGVPTPGKPESAEPTGFVARLLREDVNGYADAGLWEKLNLWMAA